MTKKLSLLLAAVAISAFAVPSMANASEATCVRIVEGKETRVGCLTGIEITGTGKDVILKSSLLGTITCSTLNLKGKITVNNGTTVEGSGNNVSPTQTGCVNGTKAVTVTSVNLTKLFTNESGKGTVSFVAAVDVGELKCTFTGTNVPGTYTPGTDLLKFVEATGVTGSPSSCGTAKLSGEFTLDRTSDSTTVLLD